jgi:AraC-like DNA-binding protein
MSEIEFSVTKITLDADSALNQNEAHIHKDCEIYINLSGDVAFAVENRIYEVSRGTAIVTMPYEYHHCIYRSNIPHCHYWITFSTQREQDFLKLFFAREKGINNRIDLNERELGILCDIPQKLLEDKGNGLDRRVLILRFFQILSAGAVMQPTAETQQLPKDVNKALAYMDAHLQEDIDIKQLAALCNVSINTLERHFKSSLGISPFEMLKRKRLIISMMYLKSGCTVTEAAQKSGFVDWSNYIQLFHKKFGITPGQYKKENSNYVKLYKRKGS